MSDQGKESILIKIFKIKFFEKFTSNNFKIKEFIIFSISNTKNSLNTQKKNVNGE